MDELLAELARLRAHDLPVRGGKVTAYVYDTGRPEVHEAAARAYLEMLEVNMLDPTAFPSVVAMEREVVGAVSRLLGGGSGIFTSGGTESIMLAVKSARDAFPLRGGKLNLVLPVTAHPAFHKAAHYLGLEVRAIPVDPISLRAVPARMAEAIDERTCLTVASAPAYPHGVVDPVAEIAALGPPCHVDACVGGWLLPWLRLAGADVPPFDLSVPGVTSLSCDLHKFGYAPKGASVVLFRDPARRRKAYFASAAWPGYTIINSTVQSARTAGPLAGAWATLRAVGEDGYLALGRATLEAALRLREGLAKIPGLTVMGDPQGSLIAFSSAELDVFVLADEARRRGWFLQPQLSYAGIPKNLHITVTGVTLAGVEALLEVVAECARAARERGPVVLPEGLVELVAGLDLDSLDDASFAELAAAVGVDLTPSGGQPEMAAVNAILDALPPAKREQILIRFLSVLYADGG
ncbi:aspartate aminotransferase family protein [Nonomuraea sp. NPDC050310]|uniref:pyridoxal phosphate-dependent decarboxylase family protein n=1 Tax=unclassified Nonomuraea TaxID=2593643 RepID=UPI0033D096FB